MIAYRIKLIILIIIILALTGGVLYLALSYFKVPLPIPVINQPTLTPTPALTPTPTPEIITEEQQLEKLAEIKSKFGTMEYCDYAKSYSVQQFNDCVMALVTMSGDKQYCQNLTDEKMKGECEGK